MKPCEKKRIFVNYDMIFKSYLL